MKYHLAIISLLTLLFFMGCIGSNIEPKASFRVEPEIVKLNEQITFTSTSVDEDGKIVNFTWMVNNQIVSYKEQMTYQFNENGTYTVTLNIVDNQQKTNQATKTLYIGVTPSDLKQLFIGSWEWSGKNQTGIWTFNTNNTSVTTFNGIAGATVTDWWHYEITNQTEICFSQPSDPLLTPACYQFKFHDNFTAKEQTICEKN